MIADTHIAFCLFLVHEFLINRLSADHSEPPTTPSTSPHQSGSTTSSSFSSSTLTSVSHTAFAICRLFPCEKKTQHSLPFKIQNLFTEILMTTPISYHFTFILLIITEGKKRHKLLINRAILPPGLFFRFLNSIELSLI